MIEKMLMLWLLMLFSIIDSLDLVVVAGEILELVFAEQILVVELSLVCYVAILPPVFILGPKHFVIAN